MDSVSQIAESRMILNFWRVSARGLVVFLGIALASAATSGAGADVRPGRTNSCTGCTLVAESPPTYPKNRYSKRAARKAWLEHKRVAGAKGRRDLRRQPGSREGWVKRLRRAQEKHADRVARAEKRKARSRTQRKRRNAGKRARKSRRESARVHVIDTPSAPARKDGAWNGKKDRPRKDGKRPKNSDGDDTFQPNWNDRRKKKDK
jgi:hypothetical protein